MIYNFKFKKNIYSKEALLRAAYQYIDTHYVHLDEDEYEYIVKLETKPDYNYTVDSKEFQNELLIQETRKVVADKTHKIREIIYARAMSSTILDENSDVADDVDIDIDADDILVNWFEVYHE